MDHDESVEQQHHLSTRKYVTPMKAPGEHKAVHNIHLHRSLRLVAILLIVLPLTVTYLFLGRELYPVTVVLLFLLNLAALLTLGVIFYRFISASFASMKEEPHLERPDQTAISQLKRGIEERTGELEAVQAELEQEEPHLEKPDQTVISQLKRDIEELTGKLESVQTELEKKERMATIGQLTATVGHELKNSIGAIRMATDVLMSRLEENSSDVSAVTDRIYRNINKSEKIIQELKDHAQSQPIRLEQVSLSKFVGQLREDYRDDYVHDKEITITWDYPQDTVMACDPGKLERACINVLDNACHALLETEAPNKTINVTVRQKAGKLNFIFEDNGPGIPDDLISRVSEPMFTTKSFGMGLGLPLVKEIMEKHHGGLQIERKHTTGTRIVLWIPHIEGTYE